VDSRSLRYSSISRRVFTRPLLLQISKGSEEPSGRDGINFSAVVVWGYMKIYEENIQKMYPLIIPNELSAMETPSREPCKPSLDPLPDAVNNECTAITPCTNSLPTREDALLPESALSKELGPSTSEM
jgi:hypothetical protein